MRSILTAPLGRSTVAGSTPEDGTPSTLMEPSAARVMVMPSCCEVPVTYPTPWEEGRTRGYQRWFGLNMSAAGCNRAHEGRIDEFLDPGEILAGHHLTVRVVIVLAAIGASLIAQILKLRLEAGMGRRAQFRQAPQFPFQAPAVDSPPVPVAIPATAFDAETLEIEVLDQFGGNQRVARVLVSPSRRRLQSTDDRPSRDMAVPVPRGRGIERRRDADRPKIGPLDRPGAAFLTEHDGHAVLAQRVLLRDLALLVRAHHDVLAGQEHVPAVRAQEREDVRVNPARKEIDEAHSDSYRGR